MEQFDRRISRAGGILACLLFSRYVAAAHAAATMATWDQPDFDNWFHQSGNDSAKRNRRRLPTSSRAADFRRPAAARCSLAFNTSTTIPLVAPSRYQLNSITVTAMLIDDGRAESRSTTQRPICWPISRAEPTIQANRSSCMGSVSATAIERLGFGVSDARRHEWRSPARSGQACRICKRPSISSRSVTTAPDSWATSSTAPAARASFEVERGRRTRAGRNRASNRGT